MKITDNSARATTPVGALLEIVHGSWKTQALCAAAELRIADHLAAGCQHVEAIAAACQCDSASLHRLLRALTSLGICLEEADGAFVLTPMGACLQDEGENSIRAWVLWWGKQLMPVWAQLPYSIRTGQEARSRVTGEEGFSGLGKTPELADLFNTAMAELTRLIARHVARTYDFPRAGRIADLGGGQGELLAAILEHLPESRGLLFDLPHAMNGAKTCLAARGVLARCDLVEGDFFQSVPEGADVYIMKSILHDWDDARAVTILTHCRRAMQPGARLLLVEHIMPERLLDSAEHQSLARLDLSMLVALGARERSQVEFQALLEKSGLKVNRILPSEMAFYLIEAMPQ